MIVFIFPLLVLLGCAAKKGADQDALVSIQLVDRNGFSETVSAKERLSRYNNVDFLTPQPYQKILRVYGRDTQGKTHSKVTSYHANGQISHYLEVVDGRAHGIYREWHANGQLKLEASVIEGVADLGAIAQSSWLFHGISQVWNEEGALLAEIPYEKGVLEGVSTYYFPHAGVWKKIPYHLHEIHGTLQIFDALGKIEEETQFAGGLREGKSVGYWREGVLKFSEECEKDQIKRGVYFSKTGEKVAEVTGGEGKKALFEGDYLHSIAEIHHGVVEGLVQQFSENGTLACEYRLREGKKWGEEREYYPTMDKGEKKPKLSVVWQEDKIHGPVATWYKNGVMESQKEMVSNKKQGMSFAWYTDGSLMFSEDYDNEKLLEGSYYKKGNPTPVSKIIGGKGVATLFDSDGNFQRKISYDRGKPEVE